MSEEWDPAGILSILSLSEVRRLIRESHARMMVVFFALVYALGSMALGGMLTITRVPGGYTAEVLWGNALGTGAWNYPGFLLVAPWGIVSLPFLATWSMVIVSVGVGLGTTVAILISVRLVRDLRRSSAQPGAVGAIAGLTPAMIALVTLGACCSTTAAATAGVGLVAQASGSSIENLLVNNWYLDLFQVAVLAVALIAQEMLLEVYGALFGLPARVAGADATVATARWDARSWAVGAFRGLLLVAGVTWSLGMFAEWTTTSPANASAALWFQWIFQHQLLAALAVSVALFPSAILGGLARRSRDPLGVALRLAVFVAGASLAIGVPPAVASAGAPGLVNEVLGSLGLPAAWGAVAPAFAPGVALYLRWAFQYVLLGGLAMLLAVAPAFVARTSGWTSRPGPAPAAFAPDPGAQPRDSSGFSIARLAGVGPDRPSAAGSARER